MTGARFKINISVACCVTFIITMIGVFPFTLYIRNSCLNPADYPTWTAEICNFSDPGRTATIFIVTIVVSFITTLLINIILYKFLKSGECPSCVCCSNDDRARFRDSHFKINIFPPQYYSPAIVDEKSPIFNN